MEMIDQPYDRKAWRELDHPDGSHYLPQANAWYWATYMKALKTGKNCALVTKCSTLEECRLWLARRYGGIVGTSKVSGMLLPEPHPAPEASEDAAVSGKEEQTPTRGRSAGRTVRKRTALCSVMWPD